jgi:hypothetical protein
MLLYKHFLHLKIVSLATLHRQWDFQFLFIFNDYSKWGKRIMTPRYVTHMLPLAYRRCMTGPGTEWVTCTISSYFLEVLHIWWGVQIRDAYYAIFYHHFLKKLLNCSVDHQILNMCKAA